MNNGLLKEGDVIFIEYGDTFYIELPSHFFGDIGCWDIVQDKIVVNSKFDWLKGDYIVYKTNLEGGGKGYRFNDNYPNGHCVYCIKANNNNIKMKFYQTGCFTAMMPNMRPVGRADIETKYTVKKNIANARS